MLMRIWLPILLLFAVSCGADRKSQLASGGGPAGCPAGVSWQYPYAPQLNANVLNFSRQHVGQSVSNGECGGLPNVALRSFRQVVRPDRRPDRRQRRLRLGTVGLGSGAGLDPVGRAARRRHPVPGRPLPVDGRKHYLDVAGRPSGQWSVQAGTVWHVSLPR